LNPWIAKALVLTGTAVMIAIRAPHGHRNRSVKVARSYKTGLETGLLVLVWIGFFVPLIWVASPALSFAEFRLLAGPLVGGVVCLGVGLWLFYRSHLFALRVRAEERMMIKRFGAEYAAYSARTHLLIPGVW
jgi:protein-S-isoprenylcysteine O-methyltransferase Ste14